MKPPPGLCVLLFFLLLAGAGSGAHAQTVLEGRVLEQSSGKAASVYVLARPQGKSTLAVAYAATDEHGFYRLSFFSTLDSLDLCLNGIGLEPQVRRVPNSNGRYDFAMNAQAFQLQEVRIQADRIVQKGSDTLVYNVAAFQGKDDAVLEDVLKKMPGIQVLESGRILYKGRPVEFTIEGMDLLKGRYGIATQNIAPRHIATVEILENHQSIKALEGLMPSDKTTLNLRLKESSKGVFIALLAAGGGYDDKGLYEGEGAGMLFGRKSQHILTAKANNRGHDLHYELADHSGSAARTLNPTLSEPGMASAPDIAQKYHYDNRSEAASFHNLFKTGNDLVIGLNALYLHDRESRHSEAVTRWMLPDSTLNVIGEDIRNTLSTHRVAADLSFKKNTPCYYLLNENAFSGNFSDIAATVNGMKQGYRLQVFRATSSLYFTRRTGARSGYNLSLNLDYEHKPYTLRVDSASGAAQENPYAGAVQQVVSDGFSAKMQTTFYRKLKFGSFTLAPAVRAHYRFNRLESDLYLPGVPTVTTLSATANRLRLHRLNVAPMLQLHHKSSRWEAELLLPLAYHFTVLHNLTDNNALRHRFFVEPELSLKYTASASVDMRFNYEFFYDEPEVNRLYTGPILNTYRSLSRYRADLTEGIRHDFLYRLDYKNVFRLFFVDFSLGYSLGEPRVLYGLNFDGIYSTSVTQESRRLWHDVYATLGLNKNFYRMEAVLKLNLGADYFQMPFLMQDKVATGYGQSYQASLDFSFCPFPFLKFAYTGQVLYSLTRQQKGESLQPLLSNANRVQLQFRLPLGIRLNLGADHYYNDASNARPNFVLFDAGLEYAYRKFRWSLSCNNLLNERRYVYSALSSASSHSLNYRLRPRLFFLSMGVSL